MGAASGPARGLAGRVARVAGSLLTVPATLSEGLRLAEALRLAREILVDRSRGPRAFALAIGAWAGNILVLWARFRAFGEPYLPLRGTVSDWKAAADEARPRAPTRR